MNLIIQSSKRLFQTKHFISPTLRCIEYSNIRNINTSGNNQSPVRSGITLAFGKYLLTTNIISSGVLMLIGDLCQQEIEYRQKKLPERYDFGRLTRMFIVGLGLGPIHHYFYVWLAKILPARNASAITKKIMLDQFVMSPACIAFFFYGMSFLERKPLQSATDELMNKCGVVYLTDWCVWPPTQFINFYYVPVRYQVLYINFITMVYNVFLSYIKHKEMAEEYVQNSAVVKLATPKKNS